MTWLALLPAAVILAAVVAWHRLKHWADQPLTPLDLALDRIDRELDADAERLVRHTLYGEHSWLERRP